MQNLQETMRLSKDIGSDYALFRRVFNRFFFCIFNTIWFDSRRDSAKKRLRDTSTCDFFPTTVHPANWPALLPLKPPNVDTPSLQWFQIVRTFWWERERYEHSSMKIGEYQLVAYNIHILKGSISALSGPSTPNSPINGSSKCSYVRKAVGKIWLRYSRERVLQSSIVRQLNSTQHMRWCSSPTRTSPSWRSGLGGPLG